MARLIPSDKELWACASQVLKMHGDDAPRHVAERIGELALQGDAEGVATWKEIARRLSELAGLAPHSGEPH